MKARSNSEAANKRFLIKSIIGKNIINNMSNNVWESTYQRDINKSAIQSTGSKVHEAGAKEILKSNLINESKCDPAIQLCTKPQACSTSFQRPEIDSDDKPITSDEVKKIKKYNALHLEKIYQKNKEYFGHFMKDCLCGICTCGHCKCDYPRNISIPVKSTNNQSIYKEEFNTKVPIDYNRVKNPYITIVEHKEKTDNSNYMKEFKSPDIDLVNFQNSIKFNNNNKNDFYEGTKHIKVPFETNTSYKANYLSWDNSIKTGKISNPYIMQTDRRYPFYCKVSNKAYGNFTNDEIISNVHTGIGKQQFKNPIGTDMNLNNQTTNALTYQVPPNVYQRAHPKISNNIALNQNTYLNQYKSSYKAIGEYPVIKCPAKEILNNKNNLNNSKVLRL